MRNQLFINNEWRDATSGDTFDVVNPATEEVLTSVAKASADDLNAAVDAARACFESDGWRSLSARARGALLYKAADLLEERRKDVAAIETKQNGKPFFESMIDVSMTISTLRYYAGWADKDTGNVLNVEGGDLSKDHHQRLHRVLYPMDRSLVLLSRYHLHLIHR